MSMQGAEAAFFDPGLGSEARQMEDLLGAQFTLESLRSVEMGEMFATQMTTMTEEAEREAVKAQKAAGAEIAAFKAEDATVEAAPPTVSVLSIEEVEEVLQGSFSSWSIQTARRRQAAQREIKQGDEIKPPHAKRVMARQQERERLNEASRRQRRRNQRQKALGRTPPEPKPPALSGSRPILAAAFAVSEGRSEWDDMMQERVQIRYPETKLQEGVPTWHEVFAVYEVTMAQEAEREAVKAQKAAGAEIAAFNAAADTTEERVTATQEELSLCDPPSVERYLILKGIRQRLAARRLEQRSRKHSGFQIDAEYTGSGRQLVAA